MSGDSEAEPLALVAWANTFLSTRQLRAEEITPDFADGVLLLNLVEQAFNKKVAKSVNLRPKQHFQKLDNVILVLEFLESEQVTLLSIDAHSIVNGRRKQTINLLWNILRELTLRSFTKISEVTQSFHSDSQAIRPMLLAWVEDTCGEKVNDLWTSMQDGKVLRKIMAALLPEEKIDFEEDRPEILVGKLFSVAEDELGIPSLVTPDELINGRSQEASIERYLCMLISAKEAASMAEKRIESEWEQKVSEIQQQKEKDYEQLRIKLEEERIQYEELVEEMERLRNIIEEQDTVEATTDAMPVLDNTMRLHSLVSEAKSASLDEARERDSELDNRFQQIIEEQQAMITELKEENIRLQSELYSAHKEMEAVVSNFKLEMKAEIVSHSGVGTIKNIGSLVEDSLVEQKGLQDFLDTRCVRGAWFMMETREVKKSRKGTFFFGQTSQEEHIKKRKRWVELRSGIVRWYKELGGPVRGFANLSLYELIPMREHDERVDDEFIESHRKASVVSSPSDFDGIPMIHLVPLIPGTAKEITLYPVRSLASEYQVDIHEWSVDLNDRIALRSYLQRMHEEATSKGSSTRCREIVEFVSDQSATDLRIHDKVRRGEELSSNEPNSFPELHHALLHFKESLIMRRNLSISLKNVALMDEVLPVLAEIFVKNPTLKSAVLSRNLLTEKAAESLFEALKGNLNIEELDLSANSLGNDGVIVLCEGVRGHLGLKRLALHRNKIADDGVCAFVDVLLYNGEHYGAPHIFPMIELEKNQIGDKGCSAIAALLSENPTIESVYLSHNFIGDDGAEALANAIRQGCGLRRLYLADNHISSRGAKALAEALNEVSSTVMIDLSDNKLIGHEGYSAFFEIESQSQFDLFRFVVNTDQ